MAQTAPKLNGIYTLQTVCVGNPRYWFTTRSITGPRDFLLPVPLSSPASVVTSIQPTLEPPPPLQPPRTLPWSSEHLSVHVFPHRRGHICLKQPKSFPFPCQLLTIDIRHFFQRLFPLVPCFPRTTSVLIANSDKLPTRETINSIQCISRRAAGVCDTQQERRKVRLGAAGEEK